MSKTLYLVKKWNKLYDEPVRFLFINKVYAQQCADDKTYDGDDQYATSFGTFSAAMANKFGLGVAALDTVLTFTVRVG